MDNFLDRNRLSEEVSPYLQQHASDPVNWQPWDVKALKGAEERDVPIFLSVGYSACHWCHVMREESFQDEEVAEILNESFVPIKVDREERPDIDQIYQKISQIVTGRGGWPLSVWLTPEQEPMYLGTYFPKRSKYGRAGFVEVLKEISKLWSNNREELEDRAKEIMKALKGENKVFRGESKEISGENTLHETAEQIFELTDLEKGGFQKSGPKFPQTTWINILLTAFYRFGLNEYKETALKTLNAMMEGGIRDHLGGGFHRYSTDPAWNVPHFEKMLYDNALLPDVYLSAYQLTGRKEYLEVARETFEFVERELKHPSGVFYSSLDARSEGKEGKFYVWNPDEIRGIIEESKNTKIFLEYFGITDEGNFNGSNVLQIKRNPRELASKYDIEEEKVEKILGEAKKVVLSARDKRTRPLRDEKVISGWNGLMISALSRGARILGKRFEKRAEKALKSLKSFLWDEDNGVLYRRYKDGETHIEGFLEDYAYLAKASFDLYQTIGQVEYLKFSRELCRSIKERFWDEETRSLFYTDKEGESLVTRLQDLDDRSKPSSTGIATWMFLNLSLIFPDEEFDRITESFLEKQKSRIENKPLEHSSLVLSMDLLSNGPIEMILVGEAPEKWKSKISEVFLPNKILLPRPGSDRVMENWLKKLQLSEVPPVWRNRTPRNNEPTLYVCSSKTCSPPINNIEEGINWARKLS